MSSTSTVSISVVKQKQDMDDLYWYVIMAAIISALALLTSLGLVVYHLRRARKRYHTLSVLSSLYHCFRILPTL